MNKLYIVHFYKEDGEKDADFFVADPTKSLEKQFQKYFKESWDILIKIEDIDGVYPIIEANDQTGKVYEIKLFKKEN